jgi:heat shock protein HtpX
MEGIMARKTSFGRDTGLQARMLLTIFLLGAVYAVLIGALFASGASGGVILIIAAGLFALQLFTSDKIALHAMGAHEVSPQEAPELHAMIERLCVQADLPKPKIAVADNPMPNAFAMGRSQKSSTVCATTGILDLLSPAELEGVMAHELTHIANRDVAIMTTASFFASIASLIVQFGFFFGGGFGGGYGGGDDDNDGGILPLILVSLLVYVVSYFLMMTLSRYREFAADRGSAVITGRPSALSSALLKISGTMERIPQKDLRAHAELNAFYIFPAGAKKSLFNLFSTHPPLEKRIEALSRLETQLQSGASVPAAA